MTEASPTRRDAAALLSGYAYLAVAGLATLVLGPLYLRLLGEARWGEVALCLTAQGVLFALDSALGPLLLRETARAASTRDAGAVFERFLRVYLGFGAALALPLLIGLIWLERHLGEAMAAVAGLALLQFLFQFANLAAIGYWHGRQQQPRAYLRSSGFLVAKHAAALALVLLWQPTGLAYFLPFALIAALEFGANLYRVRVEAPRTATTAADTPVSFQLPLAFVIAALAGVASAHIDRLWLATELTPERFGLYFLIGSLLLSLLHLQLPIQRAFLPRISAEALPLPALDRMRRVSVVLLVLPSLGLAFAAEPFLGLWLGDAARASEAATTLSGMMLAAGCLALAAPSQALLLREARYRAIAALSLGALVVQGVVLAVGVPRLGMVAGAVAWLAVGAVQLIGATWWARR